MYNVLIVEDERIIRQGILTLIDWNSLDCKIVGDCSNGADAVAFLQTHDVDILITDIIMPKVTGLELCNHVRDNYPHIKMLILSAHSDFSYAQEAIRLGATDYIIKSNFVKELPPSIVKIKDMLQATKVENTTPTYSSSELETIKLMVLEHLLNAPCIYEAKVNQLIQLLGEDLNHYYVLFSELDYMHSAIDTYNHHTSIINFYDMVFQDTWHLSFWRDSHSIFTIINFDAADETAHLQYLVMQANKALSTVNDYMSFQVNMGISLCHHSLKELKIAYEEARSIVCTLDTDNNLSIYEASISITDELSSKHEIAENLVTLTYGSDLAARNKYLSETLSLYQFHYKQLEAIKLEILIILSRCFRMVAEKDCRLEQLQQLEDQFNQEVLSCTSLQSLFKILSDLLTQIHLLTQSNPQTNNALVTYVNNYIHENYTRSIKLGDIASQLHVNSSYLSRLYKNKTGDSIITSVNKYRIQKAKELLDSGQYLVSEVANMVGIDDPAYFTNVFTKHEGLSPKSYQSR